MKGSYKAWAYWLIFVGLQLLDLLVSQLGLQELGPQIESNPLARYIWNTWGFSGLLGFKALSCLIVLGVTFKLGQVNPAWWWKAPRMAAMVLAAIVLVNTLVLGGFV